MLGEVLSLPDNETGMQSCLATSQGSPNGTGSWGMALDGTDQPQATGPPPPRVLGLPNRVGPPWIGLISVRSRPR